MLLIQVAERIWPPHAVHDTVRAIARGAAFRRSVSETLLERFVLWLGEGLAWLRERLAASDAARPIGLAVVGLLALLVVARLILAARARDEGLRIATGRSARGAAEEPFSEADRLAAEGRFEEAAHALYHGVLLSLARAERLRLDPSKTSGDYARELRARGSSSLQPFRLFARRFDGAIYGHGVSDRAFIEELRSLARPFTTRARAA